MIKIGICGYGYWGPCLARSFAASRRFQVTAIAERRDAVRRAAGEAWPSARLYANAEDLIDDDTLDAVAIATPVTQHFQLACRAIERGRHLWVEKPLCLSVAEGEEILERLNKASERRRLVGLVDHVYLFSEPVKKLYELIRSGEIGKVSYFDSLRINLGLFQSDTNVLWDLGPHDIAILDHLLDEEPAHIEATGHHHVNEEIPDVVYVTLHYCSGIIAHLNVSWMSPVKVRRIAIGGDRKMLVWDDLDRDQPLKVYNSGISLCAEDQRNIVVPNYRIGDTFSPYLRSSEPLQTMAHHFADRIQQGGFSPVSVERGLRVVRTLEAAQRSLDRSRAEVKRSLAAARSIVG